MTGKFHEIHKLLTKQTTLTKVHQQQQQQQWHTHWQQQQQQHYGCSCCWKNTVDTWQDKYNSKSQEKTGIHYRVSMSCGTLQSAINERKDCFTGIPLMPIAIQHDHSNYWNTLCYSFFNTSISSRWQLGPHRKSYIKSHLTSLYWCGLSLWTVYVINSHTL